MAFSLTWLPQVLRDAGLKVSLVDGWENRGRGPMGKVVGVMCHHTATQAPGNMPTLKTLLKGRPDLKGPLSQLGLGRDGTYYVLAAGRCNHAGEGSWQGVTTGNSSFIGIEAENRGTHKDFPWPEVQMDAYRRGVAAILAHLKRGAEFCAAHREYARPAGRKEDPIFDMDAFRAGVALILRGDAPPPRQIPRLDAQNRPTLRRGMTHPLVREIQERLGVAPLAIFGPKTEAAVREFQRGLAMVADGIVGPATWAALDAAPPPAHPLVLPPSVAAPAGGGDMPLADAVAVLRQLSGVHAAGEWSPRDTLAVQRALGALFLLNPDDDVDGVAGPRTVAAWTLFRADIRLGGGSVLDADGARLLAQHAENPAGLLGALAVEIPAAYPFRRNRRAENEDRGVRAIIQVASERQLTRAQVAYVLATAEHESDRFATLEEYASGAAYEGRADLGNSRPGDGRRYKGRGYVQLTGRNNYRQYAQRTGIRLADLPLVAMNWAALSAWILVDGMVRGAYTGRRLDEFVSPAAGRDFRNARRVVNGLNVADKIAAQAEEWLVKLP